MNLRRRINSAWNVLIGNAWAVQPVDYFSIEKHDKNGSYYMLTAADPVHLHGLALMSGQNKYEITLAGPDESFYKIALWWHT